MCLSCYIFIIDGLFKERLHIRHVERGQVYIQLAATFQMTPEFLCEGWPSSIMQLVSENYLSYLSLSLTRGRWNRRWGTFSAYSPPGAILWAGFDNPPSTDNFTVPERWNRLTHSLSDLVCCSLYRMLTTTTTLEYLFSDINSREYHHNLLERPPDWIMFGSLPEEATCMENLVPWLKLLPSEKYLLASALLHRFY